MFPALKPGQDVLVWCWFYIPRVDDLIAIRVNNREMIKRISKFSDQEKMIYVLGDNEKESTDSRNFGWIKESEIIGKVIWH